jgi:hypothetical protein
MAQQQLGQQVVGAAGEQAAGAIGQEVAANASQAGGLEGLLGDLDPRVLETLQGNLSQ